MKIEMNTILLWKTAQAESNYELLADFIEKSVENTFWMYYKYFDKDTKMKFEEYKKRMELIRKKFIKRDLRIIQKLRGIFQEIGINRNKIMKNYFRFQRKRGVKWAVNF